jgi:hypothetical protein
MEFRQLAVLFKRVQNIAKTSMPPNLGGGCGTSRAHAARRAYLTPVEGGGRCGYRQAFAGGGLAHGRSFSTM